MECPGSVKSKGGFSVKAKASDGETQRKRARRPLWRRLVRWACLAILTLCLLVAGTLVAFPYITNTDFVKDRVSRRVSTALNGARVELDVLKIAPLDAKVLLLEGLRVLPDGQAAPPLLCVGRVGCTWVPWRLLRGEVKVLGVEVSEVRLNLIESEGRWNFASLIPDTAPRPSRPPPKPRITELRLPLSLKIGSAVLKDVSVIASTQSGESVHLKDLFLEARFDLDKDVKGTARCYAFVGGLELNAPERVAVSLPDGFAACAALELAGLEDVVLSARFAAESVRCGAGSFGKLRPVKVSGNLTCKANLAGPSVPELKAHVRVGDLLEDFLTLRLSRDKGYTVEGHNRCRVDLKAATGFLSELALPKLPRVSLTGAVTSDTDLRVSIQDAVPLEGTLEVCNVLKGKSDMSLGAANNDAIPLSAKATGIEFTCTTALTGQYGSSFTGRCANRVECRIESLKADYEANTSVSAEGVTLTAETGADLPRVERLKLNGEVSISRACLSDTALGSVAVPARLGFQCDVLDVLDQEAGRIVLREVGGSLGEAVPSFSVSGVVRRPGKGPVELTILTELNVEEALALTEGLDERIRDMLGEVAVSGRITNRTTLAGTLPLPGTDASPKNGLLVESDGKAALNGFRFHRAGLEGAWEKLTAHYSAGLCLNSGFAPRDMWCRVAADAEKLSVPGKGAVGRASIEGACRASVPELTDATGRMKVSAGNVSLALPHRDKPGATEILLKPFDLTFSGEAEANLREGRFALREAEMSLPALLTLKVPSLKVERFGGGSIEAKAFFTVDDLAAVRALLPDSLSEAVPEISGELAAECTVGGSAPLAEQIAQAALSGRPLPTVSPFPLGTFFAEQMPLNIHVKASGRKIAVSHEIPGVGCVKVRDLSTGIEASLQPEGLKGNLSAELPHTSLPGLPVPLEGVGLAFSFRADQFERLDIEDFRLCGCQELFTLTAALHMKGISNVTQSPTPGSLLEALTLEGQGSLAVNPGGLSDLEGLRLSGKAGARFSLDLKGGRSAAVRASTEIHSFSVAKDGLFELKNLNASIPFSKTWDIVGPQRRRGGLSERVLDAQERRQEGFPGSSLLEYGPAAIRLLHPTESLRLDAFSLHGKTLLENLGVHLEVVGDSFLAPRYHMKLLGGTMAGTFSFAPRRDSYVMKLENEFVNVDCSALLPARFKRKESDYTVSGTLRMLMEFAGGGSEQAAGSTLRDMAVRLDVTRIGAKALDSVLLTLDPNAEEPSIVRMRSALKLASPRHLTVVARRGFVDIEAELQGLASGVVKRYSVPRFSIAAIADFSIVDELLSPLRRASELLRMLGAAHIEIGDEEPQVKFR